MNTDQAQQIVAEAITARGYDNGWTPEQMMARQVAKMQEELAELAENFHLPEIGSFEGMYYAISDVGRKCSRAFDNSSDWQYAGLAYWSEVARHSPTEGARNELTDVAVTVLKLADLLGFDVIAAAVEKAQADVARGVRGAAASVARADKAHAQTGE